MSTACARTNLPTRLGSGLAAAAANVERTDVAQHTDQNEPSGNEGSMRDYLAWEEQLPAQIEADGDAQFQIP